MLRNHILFVLRNSLKKERFIFSILVVGIAVSIASFFLLSEHVRYEESYDTFFDKSDFVYRIQTDFTNKNSGEQLKIPLIPAAIAELLQERVPEIESVSWISPKLNCAANKVDDVEVFNIENSFLADSNFFSVFPLKFLSGDAKTSLYQNNSIVISKSTANRLFGDINPIDKQVRITWAAYDDYYTVKGVFDDIPFNSHLKIDLLLTNKEMRAQQYEWNYHYTYIKLFNKQNVPKVQEMAKKIYVELYNEALEQENLNLVFSVVPINRIHLYSDVSREIKEKGDYQLVRLIQILSILVLVVCVINYVNLSSAQYAKRKEEISLRKVLGAGYGNFQSQLLVENIVSVTMGAVLGVVLLFISLPFYSKEFDVPLVASSFLSLKYLMLFALFIFVLSTISTLFPLTLFFNKTHGVRRGRKRWVLNFRNLFVGVQFILVVAIIFSMLVIKRQVNFMNTKDLGFEKEGIIFMSCPPLKMPDTEKLAKMKLFIDELEKITDVKSVSNSLTIPGRFYNNPSSFGKVGDSGDKVSGYTSNTDFNFLTTYGIKLLAGRNFYEDYNDNYGIIINNTLCKGLGFASPELSIGKEIMMNENKYTVIGVINDSHQNHMREKIEPWALTMVYKTSSFISVKMNSNAIPPATIERIKSVYSKVFPGAAFDYKYMEEFYGRLFKQDRNLANLSAIISVIIMILAIMGLVSVSSFIIAQRIKEIAVRKVLGGSFFQNFFVLLKDYLLIMSFSIAIALFASTYYMQKWLDNFSYKTVLPFTLGLIPVFIVLIMTILIVLYNAVRVEVSNPIRSLKSS